MSRRAPPAGAAPPAAPGAAQRIAIGLGLVLALALLFAHIRIYAFLCDDAFISYRYARNLAHGFGLVFNPGHERVEGYSNFLWVLILAGLDRVGALPERAAPALSIAATLALWGLVAKWALRDARPAWTGLVAPLFLVINRSFAVWATSGLETRGFELLVVAGVLRLADEVVAAREGRVRAPLAGTLLALATLTRPDGLLIAACAFACAAVTLARSATSDSSRGALVRFALGWAPYAALVGGHFLFRHAYYDAWLPNTYYAKVGGRTWWDAGFEYIAVFALEYAAWAWLPFVAAGVVALARRGRGFEPWLIGCTLIPHTLYIAAIGGDHFEYRPFDLALPFAFLLIGHGAGGLVGEAAGRARARRTLAVAAALVVVAVLGLELPWRSHREFPARYIAGFPGRRTIATERFLDPRAGFLYRIPPLDRIAGLHQRLLRSLTERFIGIRAEEHARFLATVTAEGQRLAALVADGTLPRDTYIATGSVGAIPYYSDLRTLDRLGLTDREVARSRPQAVRIMAHDRSATVADGRARGVELWAAGDVHFLWPATSTHPLDLTLQRVRYYAARLGPEEWLLVILPRGLEQTGPRFPRLHFQDGQADSFLVPYLENGIRVLRDSLARHPEDDEAQRALAGFLIGRGAWAEAFAAYRPVLERAPDDVRALLESAMCLHALGRDPEARRLIERVLALGEARSDEAIVRRARGLLDQL